MKTSSAEAFSLFDWFYDKSEPVISTGFDSSKAYNGKITVHFLIVDQDTDIETASVFLDDKDVTSKVNFGPGYYKNKFEIDTNNLKDGEHPLTIIAIDKSRLKNKTKTRLSLKVDNTPPKLYFINMSKKLYYGKTSVLLFKSSDKDLDIEGSFQGKVVRCYPMKGKSNYYRLILGSELSRSYNKKYLLHLSVTDKAGNIAHRKIHIKVFPSYYIVSRFNLKPKKVKLLSPDVIMADWERVQTVLRKKRKEKFWVGRFIRPAQGRISLPFGALEYINGVRRGRHRGLDIANRKGSYIKASNSGEVVLAEYLPAHGNTVVIDHGRGIFSYYAHLHKIKVNVDQRVWKGQIIGTMGSSGISTGSHLHFSMSVHDTRVDPAQWLNGIVAD